MKYFHPHVMIHDGLRCFSHEPSSLGGISVVMHFQQCFEIISHGPLGILQLTASCLLALTVELDSQQFAQSTSIKMGEVCMETWGHDHMAPGHLMATNQFTHTLLYFSGLDPYTFNCLTFTKVDLSELFG